jgi:nucleoid-associated protein YgaU
MRGFRGLNVRMLLMFAVVALVATGCCKQTPQEVTDVNRELGEAKDACATVYAADELEPIEADVAGMNALADDKKCKKAKKAAEPLAPQVEQLKSDSASARDAAKSEAEAAMAKAEAALADAKKAEAEKYVATAYKQAAAKAAEAENLAGDPCKYYEAKAAADEAARLAANAKQAAIAEKKRLEEERRLAEEARLRREAEEAARLEAERLAKFPPSYTVQKGDSLWRITGMDTIYGNSIYWPIVYDANDQSIADPDLIYPGQELSIPRDMAADEMEAELYKLWRDLSAAGYAPEEE